MGSTWMRRPRRSRAPSPIRFAWKTLKGIVTAIVLVVVVIVIVAIVALARAGKKIEHDETASTRSFRHAALMYRHVETGMTAAHVRRLVGKPDDVERYNDVGDREMCWYYGSLLTAARPFEFCFRHGRLVSKGRLP